MRQISTGALVQTYDAPAGTRQNTLVEISDLIESGRDCIETCLNGDGWRVDENSWSSPDGDYCLMNKAWVPRYVRNDSGEMQFIECGCPELNSLYTPHVTVEIQGEAGQSYQISAFRSPFNPPGGEIIDIGFDDPRTRTGVIGETGRVVHEFTFRLLHDETDGTLPPPTFRVAASVGGAMPLMEATISPRQELFAECLAACSSEVNGVSIPVLNGCRVDRRDAVLANARARGDFQVLAFANEGLSIIAENLDSPSHQDVVVARLSLPAMTVNIELLPMPTLTPGVVLYDQNISIYEIRYFDNSGSRLGSPEINLISPWHPVRTPNVSLTDYFGNETRLVIFKNKVPGAFTDYPTEDFGGSCDLTGDWFLSRIGDLSYCELRLQARLT